MKLRLHQFLSRTGAFGSKKELIESISKGEISVGGVIVTSPMHFFDPSRENVHWKGNMLKKAAKVYLALNKPAGFLSSRLTQGDARLGKRSVFELIENDKSLDDAAKKSLFCVGRLDEDTSGLLLITNDGSFGAQVTRPESRIEKTYVAELAKPLGRNDSKKLEKGVVIKLEENGITTNYKTSGCGIKALESDTRKIAITLSEGKKREIRRMLEAVGNKVLRLQRISIGKLRLEDLKIRECSYVLLDKETAMKAIA